MTPPSHSFGNLVSMLLLTLFVRTSGLLLIIKRNAPSLIVPRTCFIVEKCLQTVSELKFESQVKLP